MNLGGVDEEVEGGVLFKNDFVIFDEAHTVENVASRHIGLSVSSGQMRYSLQRLWNPRTEKGLLATLRKGSAVKLVADLIGEIDQFFFAVEEACENLVAAQKRNYNTAESRPAKERFNKERSWTELRIRQHDLVKDNVTLPIQRLREAISELIKTSEDSDTGQELMECNRRLAELRNEVATFLSQSEEEHVYWVERSGKTQKNLALNAAPVNVADFLRQRLFGSDTSVIMTSATLAIDSKPTKVEEKAGWVENRKSQIVSRKSGLNYFAKQVGAEKATLLQVGSPFNYEQQMRLFVAGKMPDPREAGYEDALLKWIEHFIRMTHGKAFILFTNYKLMQQIAERMQPVFAELRT